MSLECPSFKLTLAKAVIHIGATLIPLINMILFAPLAGALTLLKRVLAQRLKPGHLVQQIILGTWLLSLVEHWVQSVRRLVVAIY